MRPTLLPQLLVQPEKTIYFWLPHTFAPVHGEPVINLLVGRRRSTNENHLLKSIVPV